MATALVVYFGLMSMIGEEVDLKLGTIVAFFSYVELLFRPLRQIADKFNTLQMGMVAANRVFGILDTDSQIEDKGSLDSHEVHGAISF